MTINPAAIVRSNLEKLGGPQRAKRSRRTDANTESTPQSYVGIFVQRTSHAYSRKGALPAGDADLFRRVIEMLTAML